MGRDLFRALEQRAEKKAYDDEFLLLLVEYQRMYPKSEHFDIFYGCYAAFHGNYGVALEHARKAYRRRKACREVWKLLAGCYHALGEHEKAVPFEGYLSKFSGVPAYVTVPVDYMPQALKELSLTKGEAMYAPLCVSKCSLKDGNVVVQGGMFCGEMIPFSSDREGYGYWVGAYNEAGSIGGPGKLMQNVGMSDEALESGAADIVYDVVRAKEAKEAFVDLQGDTLIVPVAATSGNQVAAFQGRDLDDSALLGQWEYDFFRMDRPARISSESPLAFGRPIRLGHSNKRRKLVLNILVDALSWNEFRKQGFRHMPRMMKFFSEGVVFDQHFSAAEYTYPSLASIETGMYPYHSQLYQEGVVVQLDEEYTTLSERMKELGYYCVNIMGQGGGLYNGVMRGYDRLLISAYDLPAYAGVERAIRHLEAFSECDQFLFCHFLEVHPWSSKVAHVGMGVQTKLSLKDRMNGKEKRVPSVFLPKSPLYQMANRQAMENTDRSLGVLFDYIAEHYDEDEYIVQLYSDHGVSVYDEVPYILSDNATSAAWMLRGHGVPKKGMVEELTSAVDIYPTLGKLAGFPTGDWVDGNLPAAFGGRERGCVYSNSLYPGQTYKLCIRTREHEFRLESLGAVHEDGTVDLSGAELTVCTRDASHRPVEDPAVMNRFLELAKEYTESFNNEGRQWRLLPEPEQYGKEKKF